MWTVPFTAVTGNVFTAQQWNTVVRDNMLESMAGRAISDAGLFFASSNDQVEQRAPRSAYVETFETTNTNVFGDLATPGPFVDLPSDTPARGSLIFWSARLHFDTIGDIGQAAIQANRLSDNALVMSPLNASSIMYEADIAVARARCGIIHRCDDSVGSEPVRFTVKYRRVGSGTVGYSHRRMAVIPTL